MGNPPADQPFAEFATVEAYHDCMVRLEKRLDEFDRIFPGHFCLDIDSSVVHGAVKASAEVLADPDHPHFEAKLHNGRLNRFRYVEGLGTLCYGADNVYRKQKQSGKEQA